VIAGLLLASGAARRFGSNKLIERLGDHALVRWPALALADEVDELFVVVADDGAELRDALAGLPARFVVNRDAHAGLSSSIRAGVSALPPGADAVVIALGDQPLLERGVVARVIARWREGGASAVSASYADGRGHPVLFGATLFPALCTLEGDRGARELLGGLGDELALVSIDGPQPLDVDTRAALKEVSAELARRVGGAR
jgi:molybdenum cofactor cytidylyltransferase